MNTLKNWNELAAMGATKATAYLHTLSPLDLRKYDLYKHEYIEAILEHARHIRLYEDPTEG